jgi:hypothetical protein
MSTTKTRAVQVRLSNETLSYLADLSAKYGMTLSAVIRAVVCEREIKDRMNGTISPFEYLPAPTARTRGPERAAEARQNGGDARLSAAPQGMPIKSEGESSAAASAWGPMDKTTFSGTDEEWQQIPAELRGRMKRE